MQGMDPKEVGNAYNASNLSTSLVSKYLATYKFKHWIKTETTEKDVTDEMRYAKAEEIASKLCDHSFWLSHSREITRDMAEDQLGIKIVRAENVEGLNRLLRRLWAILSWIMENSPIAKLYFSKEYNLVRSEILQVGEGQL